MCLQFLIDFLGAKRFDCTITFSQQRVRELSLSSRKKLQFKHTFHYNDYNFPDVVHQNQVDWHMEEDLRFLT